MQRFTSQQFYRLANWAAGADWHLSPSGTINGSYIPDGFDEPVYVVCYPNGDGTASAVATAIGCKPVKETLAIQDIGPCSLRAIIGVCTQLEDNRQQLKR